MKFHQLQYFVTVAEELHFGKAAQKLNISQPPLSQQIKQLENSLDVLLFKRNKRNVKLTDAGKAFYEKSKVILHHIEHAKKEVIGIHRGEIGSITIGFGGTAVFDILPEIIKVCNKELPNVKLNLKQLTTSEQVKALEDRTIDVGILVTPIDHSQINTKFFRKERLLLCLPENHHLAKGNELIDAESLKNERFIMPPKLEGEGYFKALHQIFNDGGFSPNIVQTAKEQHTMVSLVAARIGVVIVPKATMNIKINNVTYRHFNKPFYKTSSLAWNKADNQTVVSIFLKVIENSVIPKFNQQ